MWISIARVVHSLDLLAQLILFGRLILQKLNHSALFCVLAGGLSRSMMASLVGCHS